MKRPVALVALLGFLSLACSALQGKPVPPDKQGYVGEWNGVGMTLTLTADGGLAYERTGGSGNTSVNAPVQAWGTDTFDAGIGPIKTTFKVNVPPHDDGGTWKMTVDGVELTRVRP